MYLCFTLYLLNKYFLVSFLEFPLIEMMSFVMGQLLHSEYLFDCTFKICNCAHLFHLKSGQKWSKYWLNISLIELIWPAMKSVSLFQQHALNLFLGVTQQFWCSSWQFESYFQNSIFFKNIVLPRARELYKIIARFFLFHYCVSQGP